MGNLECVSVEYEAGSSAKRNESLQWCKGSDMLRLIGANPLSFQEFWELVVKHGYY